MFKCASDTIFLDDFKSVLDRIAESALTRAGQTYPSGGSSRPRQVSVTTPHTSPGSFVTISARNGAGTSKGSSVGEGRENIWSVSRLTSHRRRDSSEQRILGGDAGRDDQPRIVKKTTITVSKHFGSDGPGSEASLEDSRKPDMPLQDGDLAAPTTADWANGRKRAGSSVIVGTGDVERGIPMKAWNGKKVGFE